MRSQEEAGDELIPIEATVGIRVESRKQPTEEDACLL